MSADPDERFNETCPPLGYYDCCGHCEHSPDEVYPDMHVGPCPEGCNASQSGQVTG